MVGPINRAIGLSSQYRSPRGPVGCGRAMARVKVVPARWATR